MQTQSLEQTIQTSMETCLRKMANNLAEHFDAADPNSLRLLREFRSTLNAWKQWTKWAIQNAGKAIQSTFNPKSSKKMHGKNNARANDNRFRDPMDLSTFPANKETAALREKMNQPSGLLCPAPAK